jgi:16S rRNA (cytosine967-C5)-methyltransferase
MAAVAPDQVADWAAADNREPPLVIRLRDPADDAMVTELGGARSELVPGAVVLSERPRGPVEELPGFAAGRWWVQDLGAQAVVAMLAVEPGHRVLDACAAPGGKTLAAAVHAGPEGRVVAVDKSAGRLGLLRRAVQRVGLSGVEVLERDLLAAPWAGGTFDSVLLDAPCTGLGVLRRHPEIRWARRPSDPGMQAARQRSLLLRMTDAVAPGGVLVYSVCTFSRAETTGVLEDFLSRRADFRVEEPPTGSIHPGLLDGPYLRTLPHLHDADAFFAVRLVRERGT